MIMAFLTTTMRWRHVILLYRKQLPLHGFLTLPQILRTFSTKSGWTLSEIWIISKCETQFDHVVWDKQHLKSFEVNSLVVTFHKTIFLWTKVNFGDLRSSVKTYYLLLFVQVIILMVKCEVKLKNKTCGSSKGKNEFVSRDIIEL